MLFINLNIPHSAQTLQAYQFANKTIVENESCTRHIKISNIQREHV